MATVEVDVITLVPEGWGMCLTCEALISQAEMGPPPEERGLDEYPPELQDEFQRLSSLVLDLAARYGDAVLFRILDPRSLQGLWKSIRHGVRRYPTFIINGRKKIIGLDRERLDKALREGAS